ncbi:hypothetical protein WDU94_006549 [Cyamophila willieti]
MTRAARDQTMKKSPSIKTNSSHSFRTPMRLFLILYILLAIFEPHASEPLKRTEHICGNYNGRRIFIHLNEEGFIMARNISLPKNYVSDGTQSSHLDCTIQLVTCPSCIINLEFKHLDLMPSCSNSPILQQINDKRNNACNCDVVRISESPQNSGYATPPDPNAFVPYCGFYTSKIFVQPRYKSETRSVSIKLLYSHNHHHAFTVKYSVTKNIRLFEGSVGGGGSILSPFFPVQYPRDLAMEYIIRCVGPHAASNCKIRLVFSDFNLATSSVIEMLDQHKQLLDISTGAMFRPNILLTRGPLLIVRFMANGGTGIGFKADYTFLPNNYDEKQLNPYTDCGGLVENTGGAITMMNMPEQYYDCVWIVQPLHKMYYLKTHLYVRISNARGLGNNSELQIHQGITSDRPLVESLVFPAAETYRPRREHIVPLPRGFYISLRAYFTPLSALEIAYTTFSYLDEYHVSFPTQTRDLESNFYEKPWYSHKPNYYFPKLSSYPDFTSATLMFFLASVGLMIVIFTLIGILYKMGSRARQQRELHDRLHSISQFLESVTRPNTPPGAADEPPVYEAPPDYAEALKSEASSSLGPTVVNIPPSAGSCRKVKKKRTRGSMRSRSSPGNFFPLPASSSTSLLTSSHETVNSPSSLSLALSAGPVIEGSPAHSSSPGLRSETIPDSPPPPYAYGNSEYYVYNNIIINIENADTAEAIRHVTATLSPPSIMSPNSPPSVISTSAASISISPPCRATSSGDIPPRVVSSVNELPHGPTVPFESAVTTAMSSLESSTAFVSGSLPCAVSSGVTESSCAVSSFTMDSSSNESSNVFNTCAINTAFNQDSTDTSNVLQTCAISSMTSLGKSQATPMSIDSSNILPANVTPISSAVSTRYPSETCGMSSTDSNLSSIDTCHSSLSTAMSSVMAESSTSNNFTSMTSGNTSSTANYNTSSGSVISSMSNPTSTSCNTSSYVLTCATSVPTISSPSCTILLPPFGSQSSINASNGLSTDSPNPTNGLIPLSDMSLTSSSKGSAGEMTLTNSTTIPVSNSDISLQISSCNVSVESNIRPTSIQSSSYHQVLTISNVCPTSSNISTTVSVKSNRNSSLLNFQDGNSAFPVDSVKVEAEKGKKLEVSNGPNTLQGLQPVLDTKDLTKENIPDLEENFEENVMVNKNGNFERFQNLNGETQDIHRLTNEKTIEPSHKNLTQVNTVQEVSDAEAQFMRHSGAYALNEIDVQKNDVYGTNDHYNSTERSNSNGGKNDKLCKSSTRSSSSGSISTQGKLTENHLTDNCEKLKFNRHCIPVLCDIPEKNTKRDNNANTNGLERSDIKRNPDEIFNGQQGDFEDKCVTNVIHHVKKLEISASFRENREFGNFGPMRKSKRKQIERKYSERVNNNLCGRFPKPSFGRNVESAIENFENQKGLKDNTADETSHAALIPRHSFNRHMDKPNLTTENYENPNQSHRNGFEFETAIREQSHAVDKTGQHDARNKDVGSNSLRRNSRFNVGSKAATRLNDSERVSSNVFPVSKSSRGGDFSGNIFDMKPPENCFYSKKLSGDPSNIKGELPVNFIIGGISCDDFPISSISSDTSLTSLSDESSHLSLLTPYTGPSSLSSTDLSIHTFASNVTINTADFPACHRFNRCIWKTSQKLYYFSYPMCHANRSHCNQSGCRDFPTVGCTTLIRSRTARKVEKSGATDLVIPERKDLVGVQVKFCKHSHPNVYAMNLFVGKLQ